MSGERGARLRLNVVAMASVQDLVVGGLTPFSTVDWPGQLAAVIFVAGCPWRCAYCHNTELQRRDVAGHSWDEVWELLQRRVGLLDGVVFSGGEPTVDPALPAAIAAVRALGFRVGLHSAGIYPDRLAKLLPELDWIGLDLKADAPAYERITGVRGSAAPAFRALDLVLAAGIAHELRCTVHPQLLTEANLLRLTADLVSAGAKQLILQPFRPLGCSNDGLCHSATVPDPELPARLSAATGLSVSWR